MTLGGTEDVCVGIWVFLLLDATLLNGIQHHFIVHLFCSFVDGLQGLEL